MKPEFDIAVRISAPREGGRGGWAVFEEVEGAEGASCYATGLCAGPLCA